MFSQFVAIRTSTWRIPVVVLLAELDQVVHYLDLVLHYLKFHGQNVISDPVVPAPIVVE